MSIITISRQSTPDELAAEMDRRGTVIETLEKQFAEFVERSTADVQYWKARAEAAEAKVGELERWVAAKDFAAKAYYDQVAAMTAAQTADKFTILTLRKTKDELDDALEASDRTAAALMTVLAPLAKVARDWSKQHLDGHVQDDDMVYVRAGDLRAADAALGEG